MEVNLGELIPFFKGADLKLENEFRQHSIQQKFSVGTYLSMQGDDCNWFPIIKSGIVRVYKISSTGQEMTLYRIKGGESCVLTISSLISKNQFPAVAYVEKDCEVILVPGNKINEWVDEFPAWKHYIFNYLSKVLSNVIALLEDVTFKRVDIRLAEYIVKNFISKGKIIKATHQEIAADIGTAREVVSRNLKEFEKQKMLSLERGKIIIEDLVSIQKKLSYIQ
jgi:CRP/FNR family transcriptional regulator